MSGIDKPILLDFPDSFETERLLLRAPRVGDGAVMNAALIESIDTSSTDILRLMVLGLIEGVPVHFENAAIGGDPLEISVYGSSISIRRQQAAHFQIKVEVPSV